MSADVARWVRNVLMATICVCGVNLVLYSGEPFWVGITVGLLAVCWVVWPGEG